jgi:hypothetical protein
MIAVKRGQDNRFQRLFNGPAGESWPICEQLADNVGTCHAMAALLRLATMRLRPGEAKPPKISKLRWPGGLMQIGIAAYLRNLAVRCSRLARDSRDVATRKALQAISEDLTEKAEGLESMFEIPQDKR